jgi:hypothetical protein
MKRLQKFKYFIENKDKNISENFEIFKESKDNKIGSKSIVRDICVSMLLINNSFLDALLDKGIKGRYQENSSVFLTDLKNLLIAKNRLKLGRFNDEEVCVEDDDTSKINLIFDGIKFDIEKDWNDLVNSRNIARSISDKLIPNQKLESEDVKSVFLNINKDDKHKEDIVVELKNGKQYSFFLNKNLSAQKYTLIRERIISLYWYPMILRHL